MIVVVVVVAACGVSHGVCGMRGGGRDGACRRRGGTSCMWLDARDMVT